MRKLLNTLYITTPEAYLSKDGMNVVVSVNQQEVFRSIFSVFFHKVSERPVVAACEAIILVQLNGPYLGEFVLQNLGRTIC